MEYARVNAQMVHLCLLLRLLAWFFRYALVGGEAGVFDQGRDPEWKIRQCDLV
jgi:hypothetical protein